jgi:hypothetical protein
MKHRLISYAILILGTILAAPLYSCIKSLQPDLVLQWSKTFSEGLGSSVEQTKDGGYVVCGNSPHGCIFLMKVDGVGNELWDRIFCSEHGAWKGSVQQTIDRGYIVCGNKWEDTTMSASDMWLIKTDANGNKLWDKTFEHGCANSVQQTTDGYIICGNNQIGTVRGDIWLIKTDDKGNRLWDKTFGDGTGYSIVHSVDDGYVICGEAPVAGSTSWTDQGIVMAKTDAIGHTLWNRVLERGDGRSIRQTKDGGYMVCGTDFGKRGEDAKVLLIRTDENGNKLWDKVVGDNAMGTSVLQTIDSGYIVCADIISSPLSWPWRLLGGAPTPKVSLWLIRTDANGNRLWDKTFDGYEINSFQPTTDGGYIMCGSRHPMYETLLVKLSPIQ